MEKSEYIDSLAKKLQSEFPSTSQDLIKEVARLAWDAYDDSVHEFPSELSEGVLWKNLEDPESLVGQIKGSGKEDNLKHCWNTCVGNMSFGVQRNLEKYKL